MGDPAGVRWVTRRRPDKGGGVSGFLKERPRCWLLFHFVQVEAVKKAVYGAKQTEEEEDDEGNDEEGSVKMEEAELAGIKHGVHRTVGRARMPRGYQQNSRAPVARDRVGPGVSQ